MQRALWLVVAHDLLEYIPRGGGTAIYRLNRYVPLWRVWFSSSLVWDRVYKSESLSLEQGILFQETDQLVKDNFQSRLGKPGIATQKYKQNQISFVLAGPC